MAEKILTTAREAGVEVVQDPDLVEVLSKVPLGKEIPAELYQAVAEILAFVLSRQQAYGGERSKPGLSLSTDKTKPPFQLLLRQGLYGKPGIRRKR